MMCPHCNTYVDTRTPEQQILAAWGVPKDIKLKALSLILFHKISSHEALKIIHQICDGIAQLHSIDAEE